MDDEWISIFLKYNVHIATSYYSRYNTIFDSITGISGSCEILNSNLLKLKQNNIPFRIGIVIMKLNVEEAYTLRPYLNNKFGLSEIKNFDIVRPLGRANKNLVPLEFKEKRLSGNNIINVQNYSKYFYNKVYNSCWGDKVCIKYDDSLYPCVMSNYKLGPVNNVIDILFKKNSYRFLTKDKIRHCKNCEKRYFCNECRPMIMMNKNRIKSKPRDCVYNTKKEN